jgi:carboxylesterase type B
VVANSPVLRLAQAEELGTKFAASQGARDIAALRAMSWQKLVGVTRIGNASNFRPIVDGWVLPGTVENIFAQRRQNDGPSLTGLIADEGRAATDYGMIPALTFEKQIAAVCQFCRLLSQALSFLQGREGGASEKTSTREQGRV